MKTIQFQTNIMCSSCVAKATPLLDETVGAENWRVDIKDPKKVLTVSTENLNGSDIIKVVEKAGFKSEILY